MDVIPESLEVEANDSPFEPCGTTESQACSLLAEDQKSNHHEISFESQPANSSTSALPIPTSDISEVGEDKAGSVPFDVCNDMEVKASDQNGGMDHEDTSEMKADDTSLKIATMEPSTEENDEKSDETKAEDGFPRISEKDLNRRILRQKFNDEHPVYDHRCPISGEVMLNPVIAEDGITYERSHIQDWFEECTARGLPFTSPATAEIIQPTWKDNIDMKDKILPHQDDKTGFKEIHSIHKLRTVFAELDPLREFLAETLRGWQPPQFVVIGQESSGKSTLLERLTAMPIFPRHDSFCTRMPLHVRLRYSDKIKAPTLEVFNVATSATEEGPHLIPMRWAALDVKQKMLDILEDEGNQHGVSTMRIIILTVSGPEMPSIDLIDMPGLVSSPQDLKDQTRLLVKNHIAHHQKNSMFLVTVPGDTSPNISIAMDLIQEMSLQDKTLGVFTMCDDIQLRKHDIFKERLNQFSGDTATGLNLIHRGWVATMNAQNHSEANFYAKLLQQARSEDEFFTNHMSDLHQDSVSCKALVLRMNDMYTNHLKETWAPSTIDLIESACEVAEEQNARLGLPDFHDNIDGARDLAAIEAKRILEIGLSKVVQDCCLQIFQPLQSVLSEQICKSSSLEKPELVSRWIANQKSLILATCKKAVSEAEEMFLSGLESSLMDSDSSPFRLTRFPDYQGQIISHAKLVLGKMAVSLNTAIASCTDAFFGEMSPWVSMKVTTINMQVAVDISCKSDVLVENIVFSFIRHLPCQELIDELPAIAAKVENWVESCRESRAEIQNRLDRLRAAENGIAHLLSVDLHAMLENRRQSQLRQKVVEKHNQDKSAECMRHSDKRDEQGIGSASRLSTVSQGRKRRSCVKDDLHSTKETQRKVSKQAQHQKSVGRGLKKTRLDFTEALKGGA